MNPTIKRQLRGGGVALAAIQLPRKKSIENRRVLQGVRLPRETWAEIDEFVVVPGRGTKHHTGKARVTVHRDVELDRAIAERGVAQQGEAVVDEEGGLAK